MNRKLQEPEGKSDSLQRTEGDTGPAKEPQDGLLTAQDLYLFNEGSHLRLYEKLGCHLASREGVAGAWFSVWAPDAEAVSVIGDFNSWNKGQNPLSAVGSSGIWEAFVPGITAGTV